MRESCFNPTCVGAGPHGGGEQDSGAERTRQDEGVTGAQPAFAKNAVRGDFAGHREAERRVRAFGRMAADQSDALAVETCAHPRQKLE